MTTRRKNGVYYVKRSFSGIGQVYRSLGTKNAGRAHALEAMLISLHDQGRVELVQTFLDGDVTIEELASYYETNRIHELSAQLNNPDTSLSEACKDMLRLKAPDVGAKTLEGYRTGSVTFRGLHRAWPSQPSARLSPKNASRSSRHSGSRTA